MPGSTRQSADLRPAHSDSADGNVQVAKDGKNTLYNGHRNGDA